MKPVIKYQGGKRRELPLIKQMLPPKFDRVVEPFCGGAAVSFGLQTPAILNDINPMVINLYKVLQSSDYVNVLNHINVIKTYEHDALQEAFYAARNVINNPQDFPPLIQAISYIIVRQLCFSGMERYNAKGEFNVPFGHYNKMGCNLTSDHHTFLSNTIIDHGDFEVALNHANSDDFVFIDPPYLERLGYHTGDGGEVHSRLAEILKNASYKWMIVHSDHEFYREQYKSFHIMTKDFQYAQRFGKDKDHAGASVQHLYITNYEPVDELAQGRLPLP